MSKKKGGDAGYADRIANYIVTAYARRGIRAFREVDVGTSIIGKRRRVDILVVAESQSAALAIECKYQSTPGTTDEKMPYALQDLEALRIPGCLVYSGTGWSEGVLHLLQGSEMACYCDPDPETLASTLPQAHGRNHVHATWELDHVLALTFGWWDLLTKGHHEVRVSELLPLRSRAATASGVPRPNERRDPVRADRARSARAAASKSNKSSHEGS